MENLTANESLGNGKPLLKKLTVIALMVVAVCGLSAALSVPSKFASSPAVQSLYELIDVRSPGERTSAHLTKLKRQKPATRASAPGMQPSQRALGKINRPTVSAAPEQLLSSIAQPQSIFSEPLGLDEPVDLAGLLPALSVPGGVAGLVGSPGAGGPIGGGGVIGGSSGSSGGSDSGAVDEVPGSPIAPVPEPTTWALMLVGFGLCAAALRRRSTPLACLG